MKTPREEILVGKQHLLDWLASKDPDYDLPHPLQELVERAVWTQLTEDEREIFQLRYGEGLAIRKVAEELGYTSHRIIQIKLERIERKVRDYLERHASQSILHSYNQ